MAAPSDLPFNVTDLARRPRVTSEVITVTPDMAREWLARNDHNRRVRPQVVRQYARDMRAGRWQLTGEAIKFSTTGRMIDGQHRLHGCIEADVPFTTTVITGLAEEAQDVMDTGSRRLASDMLTLSGYSNSSLLAAAAKWAILFEEDRLYTDRANRAVTHADILAWVDANPDFENVVATVSSLRSRIEIQPAILGACAWLIVQCDRDEALEFLSRWADHVELPAGSPILALINRLHRIKRNRTRVEPEALMSLVIRAWNAWREGRSLASIPTHKGGAQIRCPRPR